MKPIIVFDIEADDLLDKVTKIHCLSYKKQGSEVETIRTKKEFKHFFNQDVYFCGHNVVDYDRRLIKKIYGIDVPLNRFIDTMFLSQYLNDHLPRHSLQSVSEYYGFESKIEVEDWKGLTFEEYKERCETDVNINFNVFTEMFKELWTLYDGNRSEIMRLLSYLTHKAQAQLQWQYKGIKIDVPVVEESFAEIEGLIEDKRKILAEAMPPKANYTTYSIPNSKYKKDGSHSAHYSNWLKRLENDTLQVRDEEGDWVDAITVEYKEEDLEQIRIVINYEEPNPGSSHQIKAWLFGLGWDPCTFNDIREDGQVVRRVPQINNPEDKTEVVDSIKLLAQKEPALEELSSYSTLVHRVGKLKAFLEMKNEDDRVFMSASSLTSTMRIKHKKPLENMPKPYLPYSSAIRSSLIAGEGNVLIGADLSSIEDKTKRHFIFHLDPEYVKRQEAPGYDPHSAIAVLAKIMTEKEAEFHSKWKDEKIRDLEIKARFEEIDHKRDGAKTANFSCLPIESTQVKTPTGWKWRHELKIGDEVYSYNPKKDKIEIDHVLHIIDKVDELVLMTAKNFSIESTADHRWLVKDLEKEVMTYTTTDKISSKYNIISYAHNGEEHVVEGNSITKTEVEKRKVFCITTRNSNFIIKQGDTETITGNCTYGAGAATVAAGAKIPFDVAQDLVKAYREINWAVTAMTKEAKTKKIRDKIFIKSSISGFWRRLRRERDRLSAINQGDATYVFDLWRWLIAGRLEKLADRDKKSVEDFGYHIPFEYHDEILIEAPKHLVDDILEIMKEETQKLNDYLKLNITVGYSATVGQRYSEVS